MRSLLDDNHGTSWAKLAAHDLARLILQDDMSGAEVLARGLYRDKEPLPPLAGWLVDFDYDVIQFYKVAEYPGSSATSQPGSASAGSAAASSAGPAASAAGAASEAQDDDWEWH